MNVTPIDEPWIAITDFTINVGVAKLLVILRVPVSIYSLTSGGITLRDCQCVGLKVMFTVNGKTVCAALNEIFEKCGNPALFLKDRGSDLKKGVELWIADQASQSSESEEKQDIYVIDDISHVFANILKAEYSRLPAFIQFLSLIRKLSSAIRQTPVAFLCPPKLRTCGRYMGIYRLAQWVVKTLDLIGQCNKETRRSLLGSKIHHLFIQLELLRGFINQFVRDCSVMEAILELLKNEGINKATYDQAMEILKGLSEVSEVRKKMEKWFVNTLRIHTLLKLGECPLPISSDIIESLFGKFKHLIQRGSTHELNRSILVIPAMCGRQTKEDVMSGLDMLSGKDLNQWVQKHIPVTQRQRRMECLSAGKLSPHIGPESVRTEPSNFEKTRLSA
jgi:hypothetical protein